jgi:hypothetical protein
MRVALRLRTRPERKLVVGRRPNRGQALTFALAFVAAGLLCFAICLWRWCFDLELVTFFPLQRGVLARWQVWFGLGMALHLLASPLVSYSIGGSTPKRLDRALPASGRRLH